jgi:hypothetical protein
MVLFENFLLAHPLDDGQREGQRLSRACLVAHHQVPAFEQRVEGPVLHWEQRFHSFFLEDVDGARIGEEVLQSSGVFPELAGGA